MKLLLILIGLVPSFDQVITHFSNYWVGFVSRLCSHFGLPALIDRRPKDTFFSPFRIDNGKQTMVWSIISAAIGFGTIFLAYWLLRDQIDAENLKQEVQKLYPLTVKDYLAVSLVITLVNPIMEEFFWRGYIFRKYHERYGGGFWLGIFFAIHHIIIFAKWFEPLPLAIASFGLAAVGVFFNFLYSKTNNIYACWACHAFADIAIILIGWKLLF